MRDGLRALGMVEAPDREVHAFRRQVLEGERRAALAAEPAQRDLRRGMARRLRGRPGELVLAQVEERRARVAECELAHAAVAVVALRGLGPRLVAHGSAQAPAGQWFAALAHAASARRVPWGWANDSREGARCDRAFA